MRLFGFAIRLLLGTLAFVLLLGMAELLDARAGQEV